MSYILQKKKLDKSKAKSPRPTKSKGPGVSLYDPKYCLDIIEYFDVKPYTVVTKNVRTSTGVAEMTVKEPSDPAHFAGFARLVRVHRGTLNDWVKSHPEFAEAYKICKEIQEDYLYTNGMLGLIKEGFAKFTAQNVLGWREKSDQDLKASVEPESSKSREVVDQYLGAIDAAINERKG